MAYIDMSSTRPSRTVGFQVVTAVVIIRKALSSETLRTTWHYIPEDTTLYETSFVPSCKTLI
jgi:hypothetical protein